MAAVRVIPLDLSDEVLVRGWYEAWCASLAADDPTFVAPPLEARRRSAAAQSPSSRRLDLVAVVGSAVVGTAYVWLPVTSNAHVAQVDVLIPPDRRRQGIGTMLAESAVASLPEERTVVLGQLDIVDRPRASDPGWLLCCELGMQLSGCWGKYRLPLPWDGAAPPPSLDESYVVQTFVDGVPERYLPSLGVLHGLVSAESPSGDMVWEPSPEQPDEYRASLAQLLAGGQHHVEAIAHLRDSDEVVAFHQIVTPRGSDAGAYVPGTLVRHDHRGHGLGLAVKVAGMRTLDNLGGPWPSIQTASNEANRFMIAINETLGFRRYGEQLVMRADRATLAARPPSRA